MGGLRSHDSLRERAEETLSLFLCTSLSSLSFFLPLMAQAATMGPPLSPREIRRSGRRSAPSASTSASKSPDSDLPPRQKENSQRPPQSSSTSARKQRLKEDTEEHADDRKHATTALHPTTTSNSNSANTKGKRKNKEKDKQRLSIDVSAETLQEPADDKAMEPVEEEEQGITRCVCGSNGMWHTLFFPYRDSHTPSRRRRNRCR